MSYGINYYPGKCRLSEKNQRDLGMTGDYRRTFFGDPCPQNYTEFVLLVTFAVVPRLLAIENIRYGTIFFKDSYRVIKRKKHEINNRKAAKKLSILVLGLYLIYRFI